jgi:hypothetical protein
MPDHDHHAMLDHDDENLVAFPPIHSKEIRHPRAPPRAALYPTSRLLPSPLGRSMRNAATLTYDPDKRAETLKKHGLDFEDL